jgi:peptide/nickel transport system substrate-binding protein
MALALNVQSFIGSGDYNKNDSIGTQIVPPSIFGYDSAIKPLQQNVTEAKALMKEAGYASGFTITFDTINNLTNFQALLKQQLAAIGINLVVRLNTTDEMVNRISNPGKADTSMVCQSWLAPSGDALEAYEGVLGQGSQYNYFAYNDPTINNLINQINNTLDLAKRKSYLDQLAVYVNQQKYIIPLMSEVSVYDYRSGLVTISRADGTNYAYQTSGAVPSNLKDYSYLETMEKIFHLKS